MKGCLHYQVLE